MAPTPATPASPQALAVRSVTTDVANRYGMEAAPFEATLRGTVVPSATTREEFAAFLVVAREHKLNPLTREIYAFPKKGGGIQPIVSVDGWSRIMNEHPAFDGMEFEDERSADGKIVSVLCKMYRKDRSRPTAIREYLDECKKNTEPWNNWPYRMLRHKAMIQCARMAFGFSGIIDEDEAERLVDLGIASAEVAPRPRLKGGFGDETDANFREAAAGAAGAASTAETTGATAEPVEGGQGAAAASDGIVDAEFEETPHDPATGEVFEPSDAVVDPDFVSDSAEDDFDPSAGASSAAAAADLAVSDDVSDDHPDQRDGHPTDPEETYVLAGELPNDKGRRQTYRNGEGYSTVQAANAGKLPEYKAHPPKASDAPSTGSAAPADDGGFPGDKATAPKDDGGTKAATPVEVFEATIATAKTWAEIKAALRALSTTSAWAEMEPEGQRMIRLRIWDRVVDVREIGAKDTDPGADPQLFRVFGEVAADDEILMGTWNLLIRNAAYQGLNPDQKDGLKRFVGERRAALAAGG